MSLSMAQREAARNRPNFVYRIYSRGGTLLYIGRTSNPVARWRDHRVTKPWGKRAYYYRMLGPLTHEASVVIERNLQASENPLYGCTARKTRAIAEGSRRNYHETWDTADIPVTKINPLEVESLRPINRRIAA